MFKINYNILEDTKKEIEEFSYEEFKQNNEIYGQFEFQLSNLTIGYVDKDIPFENELVLTWIKFLTESCKNLIIDSYSIFCVVDLNNFWLEFNKVDTNIVINRKKQKEPNIPFLISNTKKLDLFDTNSEQLDILPELEFLMEINRNSKRFIEMFKNLNETLLDMEVLKDIEKNITIIDDYIFNCSVNN